LELERACVKRSRPAPVGPKAVFAVKAVKVVGEPVDIRPSTSDEGILTTGDALPARAAVAVAKYPSRTTFARLEARTQVVVIATGTLPVAVPPATRLKVIVVGVAETLIDSARVAFRVTVTVFELSWPSIERPDRRADKTNSRMMFRGFRVEMCFNPLTIAHLHDAASLRWITGAVYTLFFGEMHRQSDDVQNRNTLGDEFVFRRSKPARSYS
jgi:hypothetical protein